MATKNAPTMTEKDHFMMGAEREYEITLKVLQAYPANKIDLKPTEKSQTAQQIMWTLALGKMAVDAIVAGRLAQADFPKPPATRDELIAAFTKAHKDQMTKVKAMSEADYNAMMQVQSGAKSFMDMRRADALWFLAMDGIHHRGQLSVYLRLAGAKVPAIYGPSGDEPWS